MNAYAGPELSRRRFLTASAAGATVVAAELSACGPATARPAATGDRFADAVLEAFKTHQLVALGAADNLQEHYDALNSLLYDPRVQRVINAIVVEWGNPLYQNTIDRFIAGHPVADADLRAIWRNTTQSPLETWDQPVYEQFFRTVRAVNWRLPRRRQIRVLLGDSPIDWSKITTADQLRSVPDRNSVVVRLVERQVLANAGRALLCYGMTGLFHNAGLTGALEQRTRKHIYVIADLVTQAGSSLAARVAHYRRDSVIPTSSTWLGNVDAGALVQQTSAGRNGSQRNPFAGVLLSKLIDAGLYPGRPEDLTMTWPDPDIYFDPTYWAELVRRDALSGNQIDLNSLRQDHPPRYGR